MASTTTRRWPTCAFLVLGLLAIGLCSRLAWFTREAAGLEGERRLSKDLEGKEVDLTIPGPVGQGAKLPFITVLVSRPQRGITACRLILTPQKPFNYNDFVLDFQTVAEVNEFYRLLQGQKSKASYAERTETTVSDFYNARQRGHVEDPPVENPGDSRITGPERAIRVGWNLVVPATRITIAFPPRSVFRLERLEITETDDWDFDFTVRSPNGPGAWAQARRAVTILFPGGALCLTLLFCQWAFPNLTLHSVTVKQFILAGLLLSAGVLFFLLPPFQGPDEWAQWQEALRIWRPNAERERPLYGLADYMDYTAVQFHPENQFRANLFHVSAQEPVREAARLEVSYANQLTYFPVGLISWVFPRVETIGDALIFYYLCRMSGLLALFALLFALNRIGRLPYLAIVFFSSPRVLQPFCMISPDVMPCLLTLFAAWLFLRWDAGPTRTRAVLLALVCAAAALAKPPSLAGLLLLPVLWLRRDWIPARRVVLPLAGLLIVAVLVAGIWRVAVAIGLTNPDSPARHQLDYLGTREGWNALIADSAFFLRSRVLVLMDWFQPVGWGDTYFNFRHQALIRLSVWVALLLDLAALGVPFLRAVFRDKRRATCILCVVFAVALVQGMATFLILYLSEAHLGFPRRGFQVRYLFPSAIVLLFLPLALLPKNEQSDGDTGVRRLVAAVGAVFLPYLLLVREVELAMDLFIRYW